MPPSPGVGSIEDMAEGTPTSVLHVDDEKSTADALGRLLRADGFAVTWAPTAEKAEALLGSHAFDVILIDVWLKNGNGIDLCRSLRTSGVPSPIAMLSVEHDLEVRTGGLDAGADDFISKETPYPELRARLHALTRRGRLKQMPIVRFGEYLVDTGMNELRWRKYILELTHHEAELLARLAAAVGLPVERRVLHALWKDKGGRALDNAVYRLRRKLQQNTPLEIETVRGIGYRLLTDSDS